MKLSITLPSGKQQAGYICTKTIYNIQFSWAIWYTRYISDFCRQHLSLVTAGFLAYSAHRMWWRLFCNQHSFWWRYAFCWKHLPFTTAFTLHATITDFWRQFIWQTTTFLWLQFVRQTPTFLSGILSFDNIFLQIETSLLQRKFLLQTTSL
jgi:hypothetical protein